MRENQKRKTIEQIVKAHFENGSDRFWVALANAEVAEVLLEGIRATASPLHSDPLLVRGDAMLYLYRLLIKALRSLGLRVGTDGSRIQARGTVPIFTRNGERKVEVNFSVETALSENNLSYGHWIVSQKHLDHLWHICEFVAFVVLSLSFENHPEHLRAVSLPENLINELCARAAA